MQVNNSEKSRGILGRSTEIPGGAQDKANAHSGKSAANPYDFIPDIDFAPETAEEILGRLEDTYEGELEKLTGQSEKLPVASREKIILNTMAFELAAISQLFADRAKMNLPKYSRGNYLEVLASFWGLTRREATPAVEVAEFTLSAVREEDIFIPKGTRVSPGEKLFFATDEDLIIRSPATSGRVGITCQQAGSIGNGYTKGKINIIVDPVAYVAQVGNVEKTQGGADVEDDESLRTRIFYAPKGYSVAGPKDSYEFWVREFSQAVEGVGVTSPSAGKVDICLTLTGGEIPEGSYIERLKEYLEDKRPLTDELTIHAPKVVQFDLDITYYINRSDANREIETKAAAEAAVQQYLAWQESTIGRDLNPDKLVALVIGAGAKRIEVTKPQKQIISAGEIFKRRNVQIRYGGLEDD